MARRAKHPDERRSQVIRARMTTAERAYIQQQAAAAGIEPSEYVRRRTLGYQVPPAPSRADAALVSELNRCGVNLNQIARCLNSDRQFRTDPDMVLAELRGILEKVTVAFGT